MKFTISPEALPEPPEADRTPYKTYERVLLNPANTHSHATRPENVGKVSELIRRCPHDDYEGWRKWYLGCHPTAIDQATDRIISKLEQFREVIAEMDPATVRRWVTELILEKTYVGLHTERAILKETARRLKTTCSDSSAEDESGGIDGYIGDRPVSIKPTSYKNNRARQETIEAPIIWYETREDGSVEVDLSGFLNP